MELEYLHEFAVIARMESFSRAAEELCISQSALSKHILTLERELGVALLQRNSRSVTMTPAGAQILPLARQITELGNRVHAMAAARAEREKTVLSVASLPVMAQYGIPGLLAGFRRSHPTVTLEVRECERQELRELLDGGKCELAFARRGLETEEGLESQLLRRDHLVAALRRDHPLAGRGMITMQALQGEPLLFLDQQTGFHHLYSALCRQAGFVPNIVYTGHRPENLLELAAQGMGVALLMRGHTDYAAHDGVVCLDVAPAVECPVCLIRREGRPLTPLAEEFWDYVAGRERTENGGV